MLPAEIEPFADHHINELTKILDALHPEKTEHPETIQPIGNEELYNIVREARAALVRFKICMDDEVKQKAKYEKYAKDHGYQYS